MSNLWPSSPRDVVKRGEHRELGAGIRFLADIRFWLTSKVAWKQRRGFPCPMSRTSVVQTAFALCCGLNSSLLCRVSSLYCENSPFRMFPAMKLAMRSLLRMAGDPVEVALQTRRQQM